MGRVKKRELLVGERWKIVNFHREKHSIRKISELTGIAKSTVSDTIARFKKTTVVQVYQEVVAHQLFLHQITAI